MSRFLHFTLILIIRHFLLAVALLGTIEYSGTTHTSTTSLPLPLTSLCPWDYPPVYTGIYRRSPVVRFVCGGVTYSYCGIFSVTVPYGGFGSVLGCYYLFSWFAGFMRFSLMSSSSILGANLGFRLFVPVVLFIFSYCSVRILHASFLFLFSLFLSCVVLHVF